MLTDLALQWPDWMAEAKCSTETVEVYDVDNLPAQPGANKVAARLCGGCPVLRDCLIDALNHDTRGVVRGGIVWPLTTEYSGSFRRKIARELGVPLPALENTNRQTPRAVCDRGHVMSGDNVVVRKDGARLCRTCRMESQRVRDRRRRERERAARTGMVAA